MSAEYLMKMEALRRSREELTAQRQEIERRIALREATAAEFSAVALQSYKQKWKGLRSAAIAAKTRNDEFVREIRATQRHVDEAFMRTTQKLWPSDNQLAIEKARYLRKVEELYLGWQEKVQAIRVQTLRGLEAKKRAIEKRRYLAKKTFETEQTLDDLIQQTSHEIGLAENLEKNEAFEREVLRNQSAIQSMRLDESIREHAAGARMYMTQQAAEQLTAAHQVQGDVEDKLFETFSPRNAVKAMRHANKSVTIVEAEDNNADLDMDQLPRRSQSIVLPAPQYRTQAREDPLPGPYLNMQKYEPDRPVNEPISDARTWAKSGFQNDGRKASGAPEHHFKTDRVPHGSSDNLSTPSSIREAAMTSSFAHRHLEEVSAPKQESTSAHMTCGVYQPPSSSHNADPAATLHALSKASVSDFPLRAGDTREANSIIDLRPSQTNAEGQQPRPKHEVGREEAKGIKEGFSEPASTTPWPTVLAVPTVQGKNEFSGGKGAEETTSLQHESYWATLSAVGKADSSERTHARLETTPPPGIPSENVREINLRPSIEVRGPLEPAHNVLSFVEIPAPAETAPQDEPNAAREAVNPSRSLDSESIGLSPTRSAILADCTTLPANLTPNLITSIDSNQSSIMDFFVDKLLTTPPPRATEAKPAEETKSLPLEMDGLHGLKDDADLNPLAHSEVNDALGTIETLGEIDATSLPESFHKHESRPSPSPPSPAPDSAIPSPGQIDIGADSRTSLRTTLAPKAESLVFSSLDSISDLGSPTAHFSTSQDLDQDSIDCMPEAKSPATAEMKTAAAAQTAGSTKAPASPSLNQTSKQPRPSLFASVSMPERLKALTTLIGRVEEGVTDGEQIGASMDNESSREAKRDLLRQVVSLFCS